MNQKNVTIPTYSSKVICMPYEYNPVYIYELARKNPQILSLLDLNFKNRIKKVDETLENIIYNEYKEEDIKIEIIDGFFNNEEELELSLLEERVIKRTERRPELKMSPQGSNDNNEKEKRKQKANLDYSNALKQNSPRPT